MKRRDHVNRQRGGASAKHWARPAFRRNGNFLWPIGLQVAPLRVHAAGGDRRSIEEIAPEEIWEFESRTLQVPYPAPRGAAPGTATGRTRSCRTR